MSNPLYKYLKQTQHTKRTQSHVRTDNPRPNPNVTYDHPDIHFGGHIGGTHPQPLSLRVLCLGCGSIYYDDITIIKVQLHCPYCGISHYVSSPRIFGDNPHNIIRRIEQLDCIDPRDMIDDTTRKEE